MRGSDSLVGHRTEVPMTRLRQRMLEELQRRNYSQATIDAYIFAVQEFSQFFGRSPEGLGAEGLRRSQLYLLQEKRLVVHRC
jgi:integrase/recombinase XerD